MDKKYMELAESFVNGNISYVKKEVYSNRCELEVLKALEEMGNPYNSVESFKRVMSQ